MSQSDYIKFKKTTMILKNASTSSLQKPELPPVLTPESYTAFTTYNLETTVTNTKNSYSQLLPTGKRKIFNMEKTVATCPSFILCKNTNTRPNRVKNTIQTPTPIYKWKKTAAYTIPTKIYRVKRINNVLHTCRCSKKLCKCKTNFYTS
jgi:hypothetical protein